MAGSLSLIASALVAAPAATSRLWVEASPRGDRVPDFEVSTQEGDLALPVRAVDAPSWEVTVFIEAEVSSPGAVRRLADLLIAQLDSLTRFGSLRVVRAAPEPRSAVVPAADKALLERSLYELYFEPGASDRIRQRRTQWWREPIPDRRRQQADQEARLLRDRRDTLLAWLAEEGPSEAPRLLLLLDEGIGLQSIQYYRPDQLPTGALNPPNASELAQAATSLGWVVAPVVTSVEAKGAIEYRATEETPVGFRVGLGRGADSPAVPDLAEDSEIGLEPSLRPAATEVAEQTLGRVVTDGQSLRSLLDQLAKRRAFELTWPDALRGKVLPLRARRANGSPLAAPAWAAPDPAPSLTEARLRRLAQEDATGDLPVEAAVATGTDDAPPELLTRAEWSLVEQDEPGLVRLTTGLTLEDGARVYRHHVVAPAPLAGGDFEVRLPLQLPGATSDALVAVEALDHGIWGGGYAQFVRRDLIDSTAGEPVDWWQRLEATAVTERTVRILPLPLAGAIEGRVEVTAEASDAVARLLFLFDGERHAELTEPPFRTRVRLGRGGERHIVEAIAYDHSDEEIGRDFLVLNESAETFWVRITSPESGDHVGPVTVQAELRIPADERLERLDYYWRNELIATSREAPHQRRILIPYSDSSGFIRVEATLASGRTTEDVVLMNSARFGAQVEVEVVELFVVVTDRDGKPVRDLSAEAFEVIDSGVPQGVDSLRLADDLPLTVGLAIDSSGSLFAKLPRVQAAAANFVSGLEAGRDEAFLVGFGNRPRVVQSSTRNLGRVSRGISDLSAGGRTAVWEAVVLSLLQLEEIDGRKALVVFYDGDDEDEDFSYRQALQMARETGVPIYLIVMNNTAARTNGKGFRTRSFTGKLERMAAAGGGRVYYVATDANLDDIYGSISEELRSHYLLTYTPEATPDDSVWRTVEVKVKGRGLEARTLSGYASGLDLIQPRGQD